MKRLPSVNERGLKDRADSILIEVVGDRLSRVVPVLGAFSGGTLNYRVVRAVGRTTIRYYESKIDPMLAEEIWLDGDREHA
ncbi:MAG: hypothetical protein ABI718_06010 [Acidobacteriota bacterium]